MAIIPTVVEFDRSDLSTVASHFDRLMSSGEGWINLGPALSAEEFDAVPRKTGVGKWVSGRGPAVPMATWTPASQSGRARPGQAGVAHGVGPNALARLREAGIDLPENWTKRQDHARNGIVIDLPETAEPTEIVVWLLRVMDELALVIQASEQWIAEVHAP